MRIAFLTNSRFPPREGIARHVLEVGRRLARRGHKVTIHGLGSGAKGGASKLDGVRLIERPDPPFGPARQLTDWLRLRAWLARGADGADIVHVHLPLLPPLPIEQPLYVTIHSPMLTDAAAIREPGLKAQLLKLQARALSRRYELWYLHRAARLFAVSRGVRDELDAAYGVPPSQVAVIPNGVDLEFFAGEVLHVLVAATCSMWAGLAIARASFACSTPSPGRAFLATRACYWRARDRLRRHLPPTRGGSASQTACFSSAS